jgi:HEAT repeat protein
MSSVEFKFPPKEELIQIVQDLTRPLPQRMRSIFYLRTLGGEDSVEALCAGACVKHRSASAHLRAGAARASSPSDSHPPTSRSASSLWLTLHFVRSTFRAALANKAGTTLFRHEIAYVLGQMQAKSAIPRLVSVLSDATDDPIVRHEVRTHEGADRRSYP